MYNDIPLFRQNKQLFIGSCLNVPALRDVLLKFHKIFFTNPYNRVTVQTKLSTIGRTCPFVLSVLFVFILDIYLPKDSM